MHDKKNTKHQVDVSHEKQKDWKKNLWEIIGKYELQSNLKSITKEYHEEQCFLVLLPRVPAYHKFQQCYTARWASHYWSFWVTLIS